MDHQSLALVAAEHLACHQWSNHSVGRTKSTPAGQNGSRRGPTDACSRKGETRAPENLRVALSSRLHRHVPLIVQLPAKVDEVPRLALVSIVICARRLVIASLGYERRLSQLVVQLGLRLKCSPMTMMTTIEERPIDGGPMGSRQLGGRGSLLAGAGQLTLCIDSRSRAATRRISIQLLLPLGVKLNPVTASNLP